MKNKYIILLVSFLAIVIVAVLVLDFRRDRAGNRGDNPYELNYDEFKTVDSTLIGYSEFRQIPLAYEQVSAIASNSDRLYVAGDKSLSVLDNAGTEYLKLDFEDEIFAVAASKPILAVAFRQYFELRNPKGELIHRSKILSDSTYITSVAIHNEQLYVADAGKRKVLIFDLEGKLKSSIEGVSGSESLHGFIIPSANFDLAINNQGELWVVNPGMHALQQYNDQGDLLNSWEKASLKIDGFSGCCNPANFCFLSNGNFITSEKGLVRIKEYDVQGNLVSVVAGPDKFTEGGKSPDVCVDAEGIIYALDKDKKMVRMFRAKQN